MREKNLIFQLNDSHRVALVTHVHPDGDAYGSLLGMQHLLKSRVRWVDAYAEITPDSKFAFLPGYSTIKQVQGTEIQPYDFCIVLDCGNEERTGVFRDILRHSTVVINIDHHVSNTLFGDLNLVEPTASSTSEMIVTLSEAENIEVQPDAATCLLTGIIMDTGSFLYENTSSTTHQSAARLLKFGASQDLIRYHLFQNRPIQNVQFLGYLIEHMEILDSGKVVLLTVSDELLKRFGVAYEDMDEFVAYLRDIAGIELSVIIKELDAREVKISFRSKSWLNVNELASRLGGGGHERASGAVFKGSLEEARDSLLPLIHEVIAGGCQ